MPGLNMNAAVEAQFSGELRERLARLESWPLAGVLRRVQNEHGWSASKCRAVECAYRQFLALILVHPEQRFGMAPGDVDVFWHEHLMDTRDYLAMCTSIFGCFVHHCPRDQSIDGEADVPPYSTTTLRALHETFGGNVSSIWPTSDNSEGASKCCGHIQPLGILLAA